MSGVNKVILIGRLGNEPDFKEVNSHFSVANISLATSEKWKGKQGEAKENTEWHRVVFFNRLAEIARDYLKKGSLVYVEGKLKTDQYEKDGITRYATKIVASELNMLDGKSSTADSTAKGDFTITERSQSDNNGRAPF